MNDGVHWPSKKWLAASKNTRSGERTRYSSARDIGRSGRTVTRRSEHLAPSRSARSGSRHRHLDLLRPPRALLTSILLLLESQSSSRELTNFTYLDMDTKKRFSRHNEPLARSKGKRTIAYDSDSPRRGRSCSCNEDFDLSPKPASCLE